MRPKPPPAEEVEDSSSAGEDTPDEDKSEDAEEEAEEEEEEEEEEPEDIMPKLVEGECGPSLFVPGVFRFLEGGRWSYQAVAMAN